MSREPEIERAVGLLRQGALPQAEAIAAAVLARKPRHARACAIMAGVALEQARYDDAERWSRRAINADRRDPAYHYQLATSLAARGRLAHALAAFERTLKLQPDHPGALLGKADVLDRRGQPDRALALIEPTVRRGQASPKVAALAADLLRRRGNPTAAVEIAEAYLAHGAGRGAGGRALWRLLAEARDAADDVDGAFDAYVAANAIEPGRYQPEGMARKVDALIEVFSGERMRGYARATHGSERPVFVACMPRSGSTLLEQIIFAHPQGFGAGETRDLSDVLLAMPEVVETGRAYPHCVDDLTPAHLDRLAHDYLEAIARYDADAARVTDKSIDNFERLGIIDMLFPEARIIHTRRDPLDTCLSCFMRGLSPRSHPYSSDLTALGAHYRQYHRLMAHWRAARERPMLELDYEALVDDPEGQTRRVIEFLGLPWDDACLRFHEAKRDVTTLSRNQVSKPMYRSAVGRYRRYEHRLGPLKEALGDVLEDAPS